MKKQNTSQLKAKYQLNRHKMVNKLKKCLPILERVALNGITDLNAKDDIRIATIACCLLVSEIYYEKEVMSDKTGKTNPKDSMDDFLNGIVGEK